jgi:hypothetical protein
MKLTTSINTVSKQATELQKQAQALEDAMTFFKL